MGLWLKLFGNPLEKRFNGKDMGEVKAFFNENGDQVIDTCANCHSTWHIIKGKKYCPTCLHGCVLDDPEEAWLERQLKTLKKEA